MNECRTQGRLLGNGDGFNYSTKTMVNHYLEGKAELLYPDGEDVFPCELIHSQLCKCVAGLLHPPPSRSFPLSPV